MTDADKLRDWLNEMPYQQVWDYSERAWIISICRKLLDACEFSVRWPGMYGSAARKAIKECAKEIT